MKRQPKIYGQNRVLVGGTLGRYSGGGVDEIMTPPPDKYSYG